MAAAGSILNTVKLPAQNKIIKTLKQHIADFNSGAAVWFSGNEPGFLLRGGLQIIMAMPKKARILRF